MPYRIKENGLKLLDPDPTSLKVWGPQKAKFKYCGLPDGLKLLHLDIVPIFLPLSLKKGKTRGSFSPPHIQVCQAPCWAEP